MRGETTSRKSYNSEYFTTERLQTIILQFSIHVT
jgi:hypothetical protein